MNTGQIEELLEIVRSANHDEFQEVLTEGNTFLDLRKEIEFLTSRLENQKKRKFQIIDYITECCAGNLEYQFPISEYKDELDVISLGLNTFIEELVQNTISRDYFFKVFNRLPQKIFVFDELGKIELVNFLGKEIVGNSSNNITISIYEILPKEILKVVDEFISQNLENRIVDVSLNESNQSISHFVCSISKIDKVKNGNILLVIDDISVMKNAEANMLKATLLGQDNERKRLAYDLHDSLGQELNAIKMYLSAANRMERNSESFVNTMENVHLMLNDSINSIQEISFNLMPSSLGNKGLCISINQLVNRLNTISEIEISFTFSKENIQLNDKNDELFIYRIVQEFLNNSIKYSKSTSIQIDLTRDVAQNFVQLYLKDNGIGFDFEKVERRNGLNNIERRLKSLNSDYIFKSRVGEGTELKFTVND
jgi:signal transduction histidine kinase